MSRSLPEWIGKTNDTPIPERVRLRVFERYGGICHISCVKITASDKWDCDHILAIINGGENRESNLAPALSRPHKNKTKEDIKIKAKVARVKAKFTGAEQSTGKIKSRGFGQYANNDKQINEVFE